jgi:flagellar L-ring protein precursor FlgH
LALVLAVDAAQAQAPADARYSQYPQYFPTQPHAQPYGQPMTQPSTQPPQQPYTPYRPSDRHSRPDYSTRTTPPAQLAQTSWISPPRPIPKQVGIHDIVVVRVDELASMQSEGDVDRRKNALFDGVIKDWVYTQGLKAIRPLPQSDGDARARGQLQELYRAEAEMETRESLTLNIACRIADIRPNGNLVLEGHKQVRVNQEVWEVSLSGICRRQDIGPDGLVLSRHILDLKLDKRERGHVRDSYKRGWVLWWWDQLRLF